MVRTASKDQDPYHHDEGANVEMLKVKTPYDYWGEIRHPVKPLCARHEIVEVVHKDSKSDNEHQQSQDFLSLSQGFSLPYAK